MFSIPFHHHFHHFKISIHANILQPPSFSLPPLSPSLVPCRPQTGPPISAANHRHHHLFPFGSFKTLPFAWLRCPSPPPSLPTLLPPSQYVSLLLLLLKFTIYLVSYSLFFSFLGFFTRSKQSKIIEFNDRHRSLFFPPASA